MLAGARGGAHRPVQSSPSAHDSLNTVDLLACTRAHHKSLFAGAALEKHAREYARDSASQIIQLFSWGTHVRIVRRLVAIADELLQVLDVRLGSLARAVGTQVDRLEVTCGTHVLSALLQASAQTHSELLHSRAGLLSARNRHTQLCEQEGVLFMLYSSN